MREVADLFTFDALVFGVYEAGKLLYVARTRNPSPAPPACAGPQPQEQVLRRLPKGKSCSEYVADVLVEGTVMNAAALHSWSKVTPNTTITDVSLALAP